MAIGVCLIWINGLLNLNSAKIRFGKNKMASIENVNQYRFW